MTNRRVFSNAFCLSSLIYSSSAIISFAWRTFCVKDIQQTGSIGTYLQIDMFVIMWYRREVLKVRLLRKLLFCALKKNLSEIKCCLPSAHREVAFDSIVFCLCNKNTSWWKVHELTKSVLSFVCLFVCCFRVWWCHFIMHLFYAWQCGLGRRRIEFTCTPNRCTCTRFSSVSEPLAWLDHIWL